jgi:acyl-coenzyme A thioesterase PaaI-like protein
MTRWKQTLNLWGFALTKIPLIAFVRPSVVKLTDRECEIKIPLNFLTRNHLRSMYFGALCVGADVAGGLIAMELIRRNKRKVQFIFKDFHADFLRRPEADIHFICKDGLKIKKQLQETLRSRKRVNRSLSIIATTPSLSGDEAVARFKLGLSLKAG